jgi:hypothetical protein
LELGVVAKAQDELGQVNFGAVAWLDLDPAGESALIIGGDLFQAFQEHALAYAAESGQSDVVGQLRRPAKRRSEAAHLLVAAGEEQRADSGAWPVWIARPRMLRHYRTLGSPSNRSKLRRCVTLVPAWIIRDR